jgi:hypothetical protein
MPFKYYLRGPDSWELLSDKMQHVLPWCDGAALRENQGGMIGICFKIHHVRRATPRNATYEVRCVNSIRVHIRTMRFKNGEAAEVRYAQEMPDVLDTDLYYPARTAV